MNKTIIIFDWDDTLFPTTFVQKYNVNKQNRFAYYREFAQLEKNINKLLQISMRYGDTYILTNGSSGWFKYTLNFIPKTIKTLKKLKNIISARDRYEKYYKDKILWKFYSLYNILLKNNNINKIIFISDLEDDFKIFDRIKLIDIFSKIDLYLYKLYDKPMFGELIYQHEKLLDMFRTGKI